MSVKGKKELAKRMNGFLQQYERKAQKGKEPNDRQYDRKMEEYLKKLTPEELSSLLNQGEEE